MSAFGTDYGLIHVSASQVRVKMKESFGSSNLDHATASHNGKLIAPASKSASRTLYFATIFDEASTANLFAHGRRVAHHLNVGHNEPTTTSSDQR